MAKAAVNSEAAPVLVVGLGRGGAGKSVGLAEYAWRAQDQGREVIVADGDARSQTLSGLFPDAMRPLSEEIPDQKEFITKLLDRIVTERKSAVLDLGGGDRTLIEFGRDLMLVEFCESMGVRAVGAYFLGPDPEDLAHVWTLWKAEVFRPKTSILIFNAGVIRSGRTILGAFDKTMASDEVRQMTAEGAVPFFMRPLAVMEAAKANGAGFYAAAAGKGGLGPTHQHMVKQWLKGAEDDRVKLGLVEAMP